MLEANETVTKKLKRGKKKSKCRVRADPKICALGLIKAVTGIRMQGFALKKTSRHDALIDSSR
jgi:hypothetical protein